LRTIQQNDLPLIDPRKRVLGVIRPTVEVIDQITTTRHVGILGTPGTISSESYPIEIQKLFPDIVVTSEACPMWVPLVENGEFDKAGADYFVKQHLDSITKKDPFIDTLILGCTHYPLLINKINLFLPTRIKIVTQGNYVANRLENYLFRHPEIEERCSVDGTCRFFTTESENKFSEMASLFLQAGNKIKAEKISLE
jgi:glutamate racemase